MFFHRLTPYLIKKRFTHYGLFYGCVPVYVNMSDSDCPEVATRNWIPDWFLDAADVVAGLVSKLRRISDPHHQPMFAIRLTGLVSSD